MTTITVPGRAEAALRRLPNLHLQADDLGPADWNRLCDIELQLYGNDADYQEVELKLCAIPETTDPECGFLHFLTRYWKLVDKSLNVTRCVPNALQRDYLLRRDRENVILKYRKGGASTIIDALYYWRARFTPNYHAFIMCHVAEATDELFSRIRFGHDALPVWLRPRLKRSSKKELQFETNGARLRVMTARGKGLGRAGDADAIHLSELAHYPNVWKVLAGLAESGRKGALVDIESTPNGWNEFKAIYQDARDGKSLNRVAFFFPWPFGADNTLDTEPLTLTDEEATLADTLSLTDGQIAWRRDKQEKLGELFRQEHPEDDETCFLASGSPKFDRQLLGELAIVLREEVQPLDRSASPIGDDNGRLVVWDKPRPGWRYIIGADVAEGLPHGNYSAAGVLGFAIGEMPEQVAAWHGHLPPEDFGDILAELGRWYNQGIVAVERNNHGHSTLNTLLRQRGYRPLYRHKKFDQRSKNRGSVLGWPTDPATRPMLLDGLRDALRHQSMIFRDLRFIRECAMFEAGDEFRKDEPDDLTGTEGMRRFNDTVFAWGIAWQVYLRGGTYWKRRKAA